MTKETLFRAYTKASGVNLGDVERFFAGLSPTHLHGWEAMASAANSEVALKTSELEAEIVRLNAEIASKTSTANQTVDSLETPEGLLDQAIDLIDQDNHDSFLTKAQLQTQLALAELDQAKALRECCGAKKELELQ